MEFFGVTLTVAEIIGLVGIVILMAIWLEVKRMGDDD